MKFLAEDKDEKEKEQDYSRKETIEKMSIESDIFVSLPCDIIVLEPHLIFNFKFFPPPPPPSNSSIMKQSEYWVLRRAATLHPVHQAPDTCLPFDL